jgi:CheY-like chemotaxis protein/HPt (histidine-containing phosphotransfer) domain-containing protein
MTQKDTIADLQILVAEDAPSIQRLLNHFLVSSGARVTIVENGQQAVDAITENPADTFDVVLMDMEMPVLDGYAATQQIRDYGFRRPIIALTAHSSTDVQQKSWEAGCDDVTTKPIGRAPLVQLIESICIGTAPSAAQSAAGKSVDGNGRTSDASVFTYLDVETAKQRLVGDTEVLAEMAEVFLQFQDEYVTAVRSAVEASDASELRRSAHGLKGALADFTSAAPQQSARALEIAGESGDLSQAQQLAENLQVQVRMLCDDLKTYINSTGKLQTAIE